MAQNQTVPDEAPTASAGGETPLSDPVLWEQFRKYMRWRNNSQTASVPEVEEPSEVPLVMKVDWEEVDDIEPETFLIMMWRIREEVLGSNWSRESQLLYIIRHFNGYLAYKVDIVAEKFSKENPVWDFDAFFNYFEEHFTPLSFKVEAFMKFRSLNQGSVALEIHNERFNCFLEYCFRVDENLKAATHFILNCYIASLNPKIQDHILQDLALTSIKSLDELQKELLEIFPRSLLVLGEDRPADSVGQPLSGSVNEIQTGNKKKSRSGKRLRHSKKRSAQADSHSKKKRLYFKCEGP